MSERAILHVDMDAFFVSIELLRHPELRGKPVVVGGTGRRGVVAAASYEARSYGIFSAMPSAQAQRLCPHAVFLAGDHDLYRDVSQRVMALFGEVTPLVEPLSLDEAFLDVTGVRRLSGTPLSIAKTLRKRIWDQESLTCSIGIAPNKFLAKLGSVEGKPKISKQGPVYGPGVFVIAPGEELDYLHPLPVRALWGVGKATGKRLASLGIETVGDLANTPLDRLTTSLGNASGTHLHNLAHGRDERPVETGRGAKSISHEETFAHDISNPVDLDTELVRQCDAVAQRLRNQGLVARTTTLKVRFGDFETITRRVSANQPLGSATEMLTMARSLLADVDTSAGVRLLGVGVSNLGEDQGQQLSLDLDSQADRDPERQVRTNELIDDVRGRFGDSAIGLATATVEGELRVKRRGTQQWGPNKVESTSEVENTTNEGGRLTNKETLVELDEQFAEDAENKADGSL